MKHLPTSLIYGTILATSSAITCAQQAVVLVRHAELQGAAMADPKHLPLSEAGEARANGWRRCSRIRISGRFM